MNKRLISALAAIDEANAGDPISLMTPLGPRPKELVHAEMMTDWIRRLRPDASEPLLLAARAHHIRRWQVPRSSQPEGRTGYLRWRTGLHRFHADQAAEILAACGYEEATIQRTRDLIAKKTLGPTDPEAQALEDALCLVFLETQLAELASRVEHDKMIAVLQKTWRKISPSGRELALALALEDDAKRLIFEALQPPSDE